MFKIHLIFLLLLHLYGIASGKSNPRQEPESYYAVTGAVGGVNARLEIRELQRDPIMWNLFLLALRDFQDMDQNEIDSYYQIAGIHGMPWYDWDGVTFNPAHGTPPKYGYCPHHEMLFSTWHRPLILLFEQKLQSIAIDIADGFDDPSYDDAADRLRFPFWDWAQTVPEGEPVFPVAMSSPNISVTLADGSNEEISNPLYEYVFHPLDKTQINSTGCSFNQNAPICDHSQRTVRRAVKNSLGDFDSNHTSLNLELKSQVSGFRQTVYSIITQYHSFNDFGNDLNCRNSSIPILSVEHPHNSIHNAMDPGHMSPVPTSAFDPLFWLHHSNVDRLIAIFQALFPDTYVEQCIAKRSSWTIHPGDLLDAQSPLEPFHRTASGDWWDSTGVKNISNLGYTYPELLDSPSNETLISRINTLYRDTPLGTNDNYTPVTRTEIEYFVQVDMPVSSQFSYNVVLFMGDVDKNPATWGSQKSFLGKTASRIQIVGGGLDTIGTVVITTIVENIAKRKLVAGNVVGYVLGALQWRLELGNVEIPKSDVPGVKITLMSVQVERAALVTELDRWVGGVTILGSLE